MDGMFLINKPINWTSQDVCNKIKHLFKESKVGHCGTLDPFADGLLIVLVNNATKLLPFIQDYDKKYIAKLKLGIETDSLDCTGNIIKIDDKKIKFDRKQISDVLRTFLGKSTQKPPIFSAIKINGKPAYEYARKGINLNLKQREIEIFDIKLIDFKNDEILFYVHCSKGTYIRSLANDIANKLNTVGHLTNLTRTEIGKYTLTMSSKIEELSQDKLININDCLLGIKKYFVNDNEKTYVLHGQNLNIDEEESLVAVYDCNNTLLAIYEKISDNIYHCKRGIYRGNN